MPDYRRAYDGNTWFFTLVTGQRRAILCDDRLRPLLRQTLKTAKERWPFRIDAWVLLPDHLHCIWTLPEGDTDFSKRWGWIKKEFGKQARSVVGAATLRVRSNKNGRRGFGNGVSGNTASGAKPIMPRTATTSTSIL